MYFLSMDPVNGQLLDLELVPMQIKNFQLSKAGEADAKRLFAIIHRERKQLDLYLK
jgi:poly-gamma-glutamate synthesis protein (capsule biosynthesis protein)